MPWLSRSYIHYVSMTIAGSVGHLRSPPSPTNKETIAMVHAMVSLFVGDGGDLRCPMALACRVMVRIKSC